MDLSPPVVESSGGISPSDPGEETDNESEYSRISGEPSAKRMRRDPPAVVSAIWYEDINHQWYCPDHPEESVPECFRQSYINATVANASNDPDNPTLRQAQEGGEWLSLWEPACEREMKSLSNSRLVRKFHMMTSQLMQQYILRNLS